jgi:hypothetical protein
MNALPIPHPAVRKPAGRKTHPAADSRETHPTANEQATRCISHAGRNAGLNRSPGANSLWQINTMTAVARPGRKLLAGTGQVNQLRYEALRLPV